MKSFFDTSVLVAAFWGDHPRHESSLAALAEVKANKGFCAAHSLAEVYAVMTRLPVSPPVAPEQALLFVEDIRNRLKPVSLTGQEYAACLRDAAGRNARGGLVYDALILHAAAKSRADVVYTWNLGHFRSLAPDLAPKIRTPA
jgi:predicted nucleic acid-binding protein